VKVDDGRVKCGKLFFGRNAASGLLPSWVFDELCVGENSYDDCVRPLLKNIEILIDYAIDGKIYLDLRFHSLVANLREVLGCSHFRHVPNPLDHVQGGSPIKF
jgi:hypothetical protein